LGYVQGSRDIPDKYSHEPTMTGPLLRQSLAISAAGHIALFSFFSLSFGRRIPQAGFSQVSFWGAILQGRDPVSGPKPGNARETSAFVPKAEISTLDKNKETGLFALSGYQKPPVRSLLEGEKPVLPQGPTPLPAGLRSREPAIIFYPRLPYHFALYFKGRQTAHIELAFRSLSADKRTPLLVKRKISSGNLEADLLSMRYINRYLLAQRQFPSEKWQTVKIDLSTLDD